MYTCTYGLVEIVRKLDRNRSFLSLELAATEPDPLQLVGVTSYLEG